MSKKQPNKRRDRTAVNDAAQRLRDVKQWGADTAKNNIQQRKFNRLMRQKSDVPGAGVQ